MEYNLWVFLTIISVFGILIPIVVIFTVHQKKMKELELEALKVQKTNLQNEVDDAVERKFAEVRGRIEVLEAIVTDKKYALNEKISRLK